MHHLFPDNAAVDLLSQTSGASSGLCGAAGGGLEENTPCWGTSCSTSAFYLNAVWIQPLKTSGIHHRLPTPPSDINAHVSDLQRVCRHTGARKCQALDSPHAAIHWPAHGSGNGAANRAADGFVTFATVLCFFPLKIEASLGKRHIEGFHFTSEKFQIRQSNVLHRPESSFWIKL